MAQLVLSRTVLLAAVFGIAAGLGLESLPVNMATAMLSVIGAIYLISRKVYLPVPHIEFFRLLPQHGHLPQALKLGLTLPACTLPLVAVVSALSALTRRPDIATLAGLAFAAMFSLPTVRDSMRGLNAAHRTFLGKAANASPYVTALLLWCGAFLIWQTGI